MDIWLAILAVASYLKDIHVHMVQEGNILWDSVIRKLTCGVHRQLKGDDKASKMRVVFR